MTQSERQVVEGTVIRLLPYGAIISLSDEATGLVHISEISDDFVTDVAEYLHEGDVVEVLVLGQKEPGRFELSIKKAAGGSAAPARPAGGRRGRVTPDFEERLTEFMKQSNKRQSELRRSRQARRGG